MKFRQLLIVNCSVTVRSVHFWKRTEKQQFYFKITHYSIWSWVNPNLMQQTLEHTFTFPHMLSVRRIINLTCVALGSSPPKHICTLERPHRYVQARPLKPELLLHVWTVISSQLTLWVIIFEFTTPIFFLIYQFETQATRFEATPQCSGKHKWNRTLLHESCTPSIACRKPE